MAGKKDIFREKALEILIRKFNENSKAEAYFRMLQHDAAKTCGVMATAVLEVVRELYKMDEYRFVMTADKINDTAFEWRKIKAC